MKKISAILLAALLVCGLSVSAKPKAKLKTATYLTTIDCDACGKKVRENISFEKGVKDLKVDVPTKIVTVTFDPAKTDTTSLRKAFNKIGYQAKVVKFE